MLTLLPKAEIKELEHNSVRVESRAPWKNRAKHLQFCHLRSSLQGWYHRHGLPAGSQMRKHWAKMSELLGHKPSYYVSYECYNAVWGFEWEGEKFILYKDERGITIQVPPAEFPEDKVIPLMKMLLKLLGYRSIKKG